MIPHRAQQAWAAIWRFATIPHVAPMGWRVADGYDAWPTWKPDEDRNGRYYRRPLIELSMRGTLYRVAVHQAECQRLVREREQKDQAHHGLYGRQIRAEQVDDHRHRQETPAEQRVGQRAMQPARACDRVVLGDGDSLHAGNCSTGSQ